jgi:hypothetical protein
VRCLSKSLIFFLLCCAVPDYRQTYFKLSQLRLDAARMRSNLSSEDFNLAETKGSPAEQGLAMALHHPWRQEKTPEGLHVYGSITGGILDLSS